LGKAVGLSDLRIIEPSGYRYRTGPRPGILLRYDMMSDLRWEVAGRRRLPA